MTDAKGAEIDYKERVGNGFPLETHRMAHENRKVGDARLVFARSRPACGGLAGLVLLFAGLVVRGCASAPSIAPFVEATSQYRSAMVASGSAVDGELRGIKADDDANTFAKEWATRIQATDALVRYSQALASVVASGTQGAQAARNVADA